MGEGLPCSVLPGVQHRHAYMCASPHDMGVNSTWTASHPGGTRINAEAESLGGEQLSG